MILRFCLLLASKLASANKELRSLSVSIFTAQKMKKSFVENFIFVQCLPSLRTLLYYKNAIRPTTRFNNEIIEKLFKTTGTLKSFMRFVV